MGSIMREKKIYCGKEYLEVDIYPYTPQQQEVCRSGKRSKKEKVSQPKQKNLNDKNARRYFVQLCNSNFTEGDLHVSLTYKEKFIPQTVKEAEKEAHNFLRRVARKMKKDGVGELKYILVTESITEKEGDKIVRVHHHILINKGLDRDIIEGLWSKRREKGQKEGERIGWVNADRLQTDDMGIAALATYLTKYTNRKKRWSSSQNLVKPESRTNDFKYSKRETEKIVKEVQRDASYWEKKYKGYTLASGDYSFTTSYNENMGWYIAVKMRRKN